MTEALKVLSLFSGVGGFDLGLEQSGMKTVALCEWDLKCQSVLRHHWPDDWTRYNSDGKELSDSPRYKMIGNGVASPVAKWVGDQIMAVERD